RGGDGLPPEPLHEALVYGEVVVEDLDRHRAGQHLVVAFPHLGHATSGHRADETVPAGEDRLGRGGSGRVGHCAPTVPRAGPPWPRAQSLPDAVAGRPLWSGLRYVEGDPDDARSGVRADHGTDIADDDRLTGVDLAQLVEEVVDVGRVTVHDGEVLDVAVLTNLADEVAQRLRPGALAGLRLDLAVGHLDDRLDRQHRAEERLGGADAAALPQVLERVEGTVGPGARDQVLDGGGDLVGAPAFARQPAGCHRHEALTHRDGPRVDDPDRKVRSD